MRISRRHMLAGAGAGALGLAAGGGPAFAAMGPNDKLDLLIKGGDVLDPSQGLRGRRDIGIRYGVIEAVAPDIPAARALHVLDAGGKLVTPGLVDLHCHVYPYGSAIGIPADELTPFESSSSTPASTAARGARFSSRCRP
jgi:dihydroorotase